MMEAKQASKQALISIASSLCNYRDYLVNRLIPKIQARKKNQERNNAKDTRSSNNFPRRPPAAPAAMQLKFTQSSQHHRPCDAAIKTFSDGIVIAKAKLKPNRVQLLRID